MGTTTFVNGVPVYRTRLTIETSEEWTVLPEGHHGASVTLDCTGADVSGYVQATLDKASVDAGDAVTAFDTWEHGTITNEAKSALVNAGVYAVRFVATEGEPTLFIAV